MSGDPVRVGQPCPDFGAAALLAFGVCAALLHRERTGEGQQLDLSLLDGTVFSSIPRDGETLRTGEAPPRLALVHHRGDQCDDQRRGDERSCSRGRVENRDEDQ